jgi:AraC family transcriptional regulator, regulatory protein of adaptative response / methylated-DNA-[protein]-cysteine methyltransferase
MNALINTNADFANMPRPLSDEAPQDYAVVQAIVRTISENWREQPAVEDIAAAVGLTVTETHHLFRRWCGLSPKAFLQAVTLDQARRMIGSGQNQSLPGLSSPSLLDASFDLGLSGPGRLHDLFVTHEAMTPGEYKAGGAGLTMRYGYHPSPFGETIVVATSRGLAGLGWVDAKDKAGTAAGDGKPAGGRMGALEDMRRRWPGAQFVEDGPGTSALARRVFDPSGWQADTPLRVVLIGTDFEVRVWQGLLSIPMGRATSYGSLAERIGKPGAARAVGAAVGRNPISFVVPCHRVLGKSGQLTGYHWGLTRKRAMLGWEAGQVAG